MTRTLNAFVQSCRVTLAADRAGRSRQTAARLIDARSVMHDLTGALSREPRHDCTAGVLPCGSVGNRGGDTAEAEQDELFALIEPNIVTPLEIADDILAAGFRSRPLRGLSRQRRDRYGRSNSRKHSRAFSLSEPWRFGVAMGRRATHRLAGSRTGAGMSHQHQRLILDEKLHSASGRRRCTLRSYVSLLAEASAPRGRGARLASRRELSARGFHWRRDVRRMYK